MSLLSSSNSTHNIKRFVAGYDSLWKWGIRGFVRQVFLAGKEAQERAALQGTVVTNGALQHRIASFQRVQYRTQRHSTVDFECHLEAYVRQGAQMRRKYDSDHDSVCTSTESTAGRSRTMGFQLSPASAEAYT